MSKMSVVLLAGFLTVSLVSAGYADTPVKKKYKPTVKHAIHELDEAKVILAKLPADESGHIAKAQELVNQAHAELALVKTGK